MRINFATAQEARLWRALKQARELLRGTVNRGGCAAGPGRVTSGHKL
jgi:hypothetical protein